METHPCTEPFINGAQAEIEWRDLLDDGLEEDSFWDGDKNGFFYFDLDEQRDLLRRRTSRFRHLKMWTVMVTILAGTVAQPVPT